MKKVLSRYIVKEDTIALLPAKSFEYNTIVITTSDKLYVNMTPFEIIKESCLGDLATYEGRRMAVHKLIGYKNKVPILINSENNILSFPTASPANDSCIWLFYSHIKGIKDIKNKRKAKGKNKSTVYFTNDTEISLETSYFTLSGQYSRTAFCERIIRSQED